MQPHHSVGIDLEALTDQVYNTLRHPPPSSPYPIRKEPLPPSHTFRWTYACLIMMGLTFFSLALTLYDVDVRWIQPLQTWLAGA